MAVYGQPLSIVYLPADVDLTQRYANLRDLGVRRLSRLKPPLSSPPGHIVGRFFAALAPDARWVLIIARRKPGRPPRSGRLTDRPMLVLTFAGLEELNDCLRYEGPIQGNDDGGARVPRSGPTPPARPGGARRTLDDILNPPRSY